jgi:metal-responsive CopG/Arc/MetJ family transcriptional regulator
MARTAVKLAVSLPKAKVQRLREVQAREGRSLSAVIDMAVEEWLQRRERAEMERQYREYFASEATRTEHRRLARTMATTAAAVWPEE